jgi:hypothetical protein
MADAPDYAPLTAALVRRAAEPAWPDELPDAPAAAATSDWRGDLKLFAFTWAAGFVFFLAFIA